jgi:hypothetical protein
MAKLHTWIGFMLLVLCFVTVGASALPVNETANGFRISFDAKDDTNMIMKLWSDGDKLFDAPLDVPEINATGLICVVAGNVNDADKKIATCFVLALNNSENTSKIEEYITTNNTEKHMQVYDMVLDGHRGLFFKDGDSPSDPDMKYGALYWLDEYQGNASKLVLVVSSWPWDSGTEKLLNTIHVEEIEPILVS